MGEVVEFRDFQSRAARERAQKALEEHAIQIANEAFPSVFGLSAGIDALTESPAAKYERLAYTAPEKDPA